MSAAQYLPPGGRGTAKRWMRNGDTLPVATQSIQTVQPFPMYFFNEMHTDLEHIAVPHPPQCALLKHLPPGGRHCAPTSLQTPIYRTVGQNRSANLKSSPKGIPHLISHISYLISAYPAPSAPGDRKGRPCADGVHYSKKRAFPLPFSWLCTGGG